MTNETKSQYERHPDDVDYAGPGGPVTPSGLTDLIIAVRRQDVIIRSLQERVDALERKLNRAQSDIAMLNATMAANSRR